MSNTITIDKHEPCEKCGATGTTSLKMLEGNQMAVWCANCYASWDAERIAEKERRLLADWGTLGQRRTA